MFRRLAAIAVLLLLAAAPSGARAQSKELLLFNWTNYISPALLKRFEAETGIKVTLDTYDTNESMLAKLQAGGTGYDVVVPSGPTVKQMIRDGLLLNADVNAMPNFKYVRAPFDKPEYDPARDYSAPYMWGTTGIAYDTAVAKSPLSDSWKEIFEPRPEFAGKIAMLSDMGEVFVAAAFYLGFDRCTENPAEGQKILELLQAQKPSVKLYSASGTIDRMASGEVAMHQAWNGSFHRAHAKRATLAYIYPREGVNLWADNFAIAKGARNIDNAKVFINFMMDPKNAAEASNFTGYNNTITGSDAFLDDTLRSDPAVNTPAAMMGRLNLSRECPKGSLDLRERIWTRLQR
jgi:spermidine/putrescine transport system substrate-binding protein